MKTNRNYIRHLLNEYGRPDGLIFGIAFYPSWNSFFDTEGSLIYRGVNEEMEKHIWEGFKKGIYKVGGLDYKEFQIQRALGCLPNKCIVESVPSKLCKD